MILGWALLVIAAALVGVAIALDSGVGRALNGVGGLLWLGGTGLLLREVRHGRLDARTWIVVGVAVVALSSLLSPRDPGAASVGFLAGGCLIAVATGRAAGRVGVVGLLPALWLPTHLGVAAIRTLYRALADQPADIRTDPPPTAALVPLAMVVMALAGGQLGGFLADRRRVGIDTSAVSRTDEVAG